MITSVDAGNNYIVTTATASPNQQFQKDQDQFHQTSSSSSFHSKNTCDNQTCLDKSTSINDQQINQR